MWLALIGCVAAATLLAAGYIRPRFQQPLLRAGLSADLTHAIVNGALLDLPMAFILRAAAAGLLNAIGTPGLLLLADAPLWLQIVVFLFVGDLLKWSIHVLHHRVPFLWRLHQVHHSTRQMDALSHARSHPLEFLLNRVPFLMLFVVVLGIDARVIAWYSAIDLVQGLWVHSNTRLRTGPAEIRDRHAGVPPLASCERPGGHRSELRRLPVDLGLAVRDRLLSVRARSAGVRCARPRAVAALQRSPADALQLARRPRGRAWNFAHTPPSKSNGRCVT